METNKIDDYVNASWCTAGARAWTAMNATGWPPLERALWHQEMGTAVGYPWSHKGEALTRKMSKKNFKNSFISVLIFVSTLLHQLKKVQQVVKRCILLFFSIARINSFIFFTNYLAPTFSYSLIRKRSRFTTKISVGNTKVLCLQQNKVIPNCAK